LNALQVLLEFVNSIPYLKKFKIPLDINLILDVYSPASVEKKFYREAIDVNKLRRGLRALWL